MKKIKTIKLKATFLLTVFALNTVVAFACSVGLNLGYNKYHHNDEKQSVAVQSHCHSTKTQSQQHPVKSSSNHHEGVSHDQQEQVPEQDDCCNKSAIQFQQVDKSVAAAKIHISTPVILLAVQNLSNLIFQHSVNNTSTKCFHFVRSDHPPIPDIRIAIRSFQI